MARATKPAPKEQPNEGAAVREGIQLVRGEEVDLSEKDVQDIADQFVEGEDFTTPEELRDLILQEVALSEEDDSDHFGEEVEPLEESPGGAKRGREDSPDDYKLRVTRDGLMYRGRFYKKGQFIYVSEEVFNLTDDEQKERFGEVFFEKE